MMEDLLGPFDQLNRERQEWAYRLRVRPKPGFEMYVGSKTDHVFFYPEHPSPRELLAAFMRTLENANG